MIATGFKNPFDCMKIVLNSLISHKKSFLLFLLAFQFCSGENVNNNDFDYLLFSIRWLPTACIEYIQKDFSLFDSKYCVLPKNYQIWAIHGLWPDQDHHMGPFYCNRSMIFDIHKLEPIESDLKLYWPNIEGGKDIASLWQHEWEKHGTCAAQLESLDNEMKYFNTSLTFFKTLQLQNILNKYIKPSDTEQIYVGDLIQEIKGSYGKMPQVHCVFEAKTHRAYLSEIHICFNKNLELINCKNIKSKKFNRNGDLLSGYTNCPLDRKIIYPDKVGLSVSNDLTSNDSQRNEYYEKLEFSLHVLRFLQWVFI